jgi:hypothetical protein
LIENFIISIIHLTMLFNSYNSLFTYIVDEDKAVNFAIETNLIKAERQCECGAILKLEKDTRHKFGYRFRCSKGRSLCRKSYSIIYGSWFGKSKLSIRDQILFIYCYCIEISSTQLKGLFGVSANTASDWNNYFRDLCAIYLSETNSSKIGGNGLTVEIDESKIYKNKNHTGRLTTMQERNVWLFGGICRESGETFFCLVPDRREITLMEKLQIHVNNGTHIISDSWRGYLNVRNYGYTHSMINHSENFISPNNSEIHTQTIERTWLGLKQNIPKGSRYESPYHG